MKGVALKDGEVIHPDFVLSSQTTSESAIRSSADQVRSSGAPGGAPSAGRVRRFSPRWEDRRELVRARSTRGAGSAKES